MNNSIPNGSSQQQEDQSDRVSREAAFQEYFQEMRRYRDYELASSTWYTAFLLAALGFVLTVMYGSGEFRDIGNVAKSCFWFQLGVVLLLNVLGAAALFSVRYANLRYSELRDYVFPEKGNIFFRDSYPMFRPSRRSIKPHHAIYAVHFMILVVADFVVLYPSGPSGILLGLLLTACLGSLIFLVILPFRPTRKAKKKDTHQA